MPDDEMIAFLRARHAEERAAALDAGDAAGTPDNPDYDWVGAGTHVSASGGVIAAGCQGDMDSPIADHVAYWDPARVLATLAAEHAIVHMYETCCAARDGAPPPLLHAARATVWAIRGVVVELAAARGAHSDYKPSWRLDG